MAGGRPTKYNDEVLATAKDYIVNYEEYGDIVPSVAGLACELGIARETIYDWIKQESKSEFSDTVKQLLTAQERKLINGSLGNSLNPMIAKLLLAGHGHSEKQEINHQSSDGSMTHPGYKIVDE
jgi:hypothetical protein